MDIQDYTVSINIDIPADKKIIITWSRHVRLESKIPAGSNLGTYEEVGSTKKTKIKAPISGKIIHLETSGNEVSPFKVCVIEKCRHDVQLGKQFCTFCGEKILDSQNDSVGFVPQSFAVSSQKARELYADHELKVLGSQKLFLILDLDNTLIHAEFLRHKDKRIEAGFNPEEEGMATIRLGYDKFVVKLRPFLTEFLADLNSKYLVHVYTKGTRDYAEEIVRQIDPTGLYLSKERLISRNEMGENEYKSIQKVIHDGSLALILDDRNDVWEGMNKNLVYTQPYDIFGHNSGKLVITRKTDVFLYMIKDLLEMVHELFYMFFAKGSRLRIPEIYHMIKGSLFANERISFYKVFNNEEELKKSKEYGFLKMLGAASITLEPTKETTLIFAHYDTRIKTYPETEVPVVSLWYIYYCEMYCTHLDPHDFDVRHPDGVIRILEKSMNKSQEERNAAKDQIEEFLKNKESNKGGLESIRDAVIKKLEEKSKGKEVSNYSDEDEDVITKKMRLEINGEVQEKEVSKLADKEEDRQLENPEGKDAEKQETVDKALSQTQNGLNE